MSSNCPPQLQLSLQPSTTSFKRSFEQFGFDLESPGGATDAGGSGANNGNDRNKRARSASSFSEGSDSMDSSTITSGSSGSSPSRHEVDAVVNEATTSPIAVLGANIPTHSALEPPRLPTPDIQDIEMPDYPMDGGSSESFADSLVPQVPDSEDRYRLSLDRYNPFHTEMSVLRQPQSISPLVPRSPTPPVLPPLYISEDQTRLSTSAIPFLHPPPPPESHSTTSHAGSFFDNEGPSSVRPQSPTTNHDNSVYEERGQGRGQENSLFQNEFQPNRDSLAFSSPSNRLQSNNIRSSRPERRPVPPSRHPLSTSNPAHFREHLNSALDHLRSPSPLVPGLEDVGEEASLPHSHVNNRISRALPNPPTLPPIVTDTDNDNWNQNSPLDIFAPRISSSPSRDTSSFTSPTTNFGSSTSGSSSGSLDLGDHPLPSPRLHDLHSWMDVSSSGSGSGSSHSWDVHPLSNSSVTIDSMRDSSDVASNQGTFATSSTGQSRTGREYTPSLPQQLNSLSSSGLASPLRHWRFLRMSYLEGSRRGWPSTSSSTPTSTSMSTSTSISQTDSDSQLNTSTSPSGLPLLSFNRRSADEAAVRSLDQGFDSSLSFSARPSPPRRRSLSYAERLRLHEPAQSTEATATRGRVHTSNGNISELLGRMADEADTGDRGLTNLQTNTTTAFTAPSRSTYLTSTLERLHNSRENLSGLLGGRLDELDSRDNGSARPNSSTSQTTSTADSRLTNNGTNVVESRTGFNNNSRDLYLRNRLRSYGASMIRPGASNSLVSESAVEARRRADRIEVLNEAGRRDSGGSSVGGESFDAQLSNVAADLRENGMSSIGWDPTLLNRRPTNDSEAREDSRRLQEWPPNQWSHASWRQPANVNHRPSYLPFPEHNILPLPGLSSNDDTDMMIAESIGFSTSRSALSNNNTRNNQILPSSLYDNPNSSRTTGRPSDYFWLNSSRPASSDQNSMDTSVSPQLPSAPETDIFDSRFSDMVNTIVGTSSTNADQRRHSASSDSSLSDSVHETRSNQPYLGDPPSLPPPDLGGVFDAERHASSIVISDESPETILVHPPQRPLGDSRANPSFNDRPPPSIPIQDDANSSTANNIRISYTDVGQRHQALLTSEIDAMVRRRRSQVEARRISALAEEIRGLGGSQGSNPVTNPTRTQARTVGDLQRPSTLGQNNRNTTIEPAERRNHSRSVPAPAANPSETPFARYQGLDPASFTPGPFRNTVQHFFNDDRRHTQRRPDPSPSVPPTIPPFSFEDTDLSALHQRILHSLRRTTETAETVSTSNRDMTDERQRREGTVERMRAELQAASRRIPDVARGGVSASSESNRRRERSDIHRYLTQQQVRMEASRLEDPETPVSSSRSGGDIQGLSQAIDALRHDGSSAFRSQQLIEQFRRERESARSRNVGTEPEPSPVATTTPTGPPGGPRRPDGRRLFMRRETGRTTGDEERRSAFSSAVIQHINQEEQRESEEMAAMGLSHSMRGRRGRFPRIPPEVLYSLAGRQARRGGTFGDYMRDEDFDESYEGLLSLSATLGDVKPKSTPASIISGLESAQYKDWATSESDQRCPICLDDYQSTDQVLKLNNCSHWLHKDCLHQWLQGARTCPVCRKSVYPTSQASPTSRRPHPRHSHPHYPFGGPNPWRRDHPPPPPPPPGGGVLDPV